LVVLRTLETQGLVSSYYRSCGGGSVHLIAAEFRDKVSCENRPVLSHIKTIQPQ
jgi:hypothetical protein